MYLLLTLFLKKGYFEFHFEITIGTRMTLMLRITDLNGFNLSIIIYYFFLYLWYVKLFTQNEKITINKNPRLKIRVIRVPMNPKKTI